MKNAYLMKNVDSGSDYLRSTDKLLLERSITLDDSSAFTYDFSDILKDDAEVAYTVLRHDDLSSGSLSGSAAVPTSEDATLLILVSASDIREM